LGVAGRGKGLGGALLGGLANAVLGRVAAEGRALLARQEGVRLNIPPWLWQRWCATYGEADARRIAEASLVEPPLDIALKPGADAEAGAGGRSGRLLSTGGIRLPPRPSRIDGPAGLTAR